MKRCNIDVLGDTFIFHFKPGTCCSKYANQSDGCTCINGISK